SPNGLLRSAPDRLHVEWAIYMVSSFHLTRSARLGLAHPMNADERRWDAKDKKFEAISDSSQAPASIGAKRGVQKNPVRKRRVSTL
ncbi:MAG TPA: hypothetical protein VN893_22795, partial [Bryobacteraceae bacterium]|nr:hypothetical protein [Bryobacteraceae bacterium]